MGRGVPPSREVGRDDPIAPQGKRFERDVEMTRKLMMMVAAVAAAFGAWAETETVDGYTWTYRINGDTAEIMV